MTRHQIAAHVRRYRRPTANLLACIAWASLAVAITAIAWGGLEPRSVAGVMSGRKMPEQKPGQSEQAVGTPPEFLRAVERRFGPIRWDLAANAANHVAPGWYGPGSPDGEDAIAQDWSTRGGVLYCNPPFGNIPPFARKCAEDGPRGARVKMLVPAAVSTEWWFKFVHQRALVLFIRPRLKFIGHDAGFPKDLALVCGGPWVAPGYSTWRWDHPTEVAAP